MLPVVHINSSYSDEAAESGWWQRYLLQILRMHPPAIHQRLVPSRPLLSSRRSLSWLPPLPPDYRDVLPSAYPLQPRTVTDSFYHSSLIHSPYYISLSCVIPVSHICISWVFCDNSCSGFAVPQLPESCLPWSLLANKVNPRGNSVSR